MMIKRQWNQDHMKWSQGVFIQDIGGKERRVGKGNKYGKMAVSMKDIGKTIRHKAKGD